MRGFSLGVSGFQRYIWNVFNLGSGALGASPTEAMDRTKTAPGRDAVVVQEALPRTRHVEERRVAMTADRNFSCSVRVQLMIKEDLGTRGVAGFLARYMPGRKSLTTTEYASGGNQVKIVMYCRLT